MHLARHKRETHCTERQYVCEHESCDSRFYRKDDLRHHVRRKHDCPQFGRRAKRHRKGFSAIDSTAAPVKRGGARRKLSLKADPDSLGANTGAGSGGTGSEGTEGLDEPKVVIDLNVAKVNHL
ncbi:unnamed protein product, partial [Medioppia subpectinata]